MQFGTSETAPNIHHSPTELVTITMDDPTGRAVAAGAAAVGGGGGGGGGGLEFEETVEQLRERLAAMKRLVGEDMDKQRAQRQQQQQLRQNTNADSIIDGKFLSAVFAVVLLLIVCVSGYAFVNLYYAILKKFPAREHSEL